jgi:hypothetical protein
VTVSELLERTVERSALRETSPGYSAAPLEQIVPADGRTLVVKRISPRWDAIMQPTHDSGRAGSLFASGLMDRFPPVVDHAVVVAEPLDDGWIIVMRDVSDALLPDDRRLTRPKARRILEAAAALHDTFRGEQIEGLCSIVDHLSLFAPGTAARERIDPNPIIESIGRGWALFPEIAPDDNAGAIRAIHEQPAQLATELA